MEFWEFTKSCDGVGTEERSFLFSFLVDYLPKKEGHAFLWHTFTGLLLPLGKIFHEHYSKGISKKGRNKNAEIGGVS